MFENLGPQKGSPRDRVHKITSFIISAIVFALMIYVVLLLANIIPSEESREHKRRLKRGQEILSILKIEVSEGGFVKKLTSSQQVIYMPQLVVRMINTSKETFPQASLECRFTRAKQFICGSAVTVNNLEPGVSRKVTLKCVDLSITGSVIYGIGLEDAKKGLNYTVTLSTEKISVLALTDTVPFRLLE
jgi:hypothetical protein